MSMFMSNAFTYKKENKNPRETKLGREKKKILPWVLLYDFCVE